MRAAPARLRVVNRFLLLLIVALVACDCSGGEPSSDDELPIQDLGVVLGPDGAAGVCCRPDPPSCSCTATGGWAPSRASCDTFGTCDEANWSYGTDEWGCPILIGSGSWEGCFPEPDGGAPLISPGEACTPERGCRSAASACLVDEPGEGDLGGPDDPILNHPDGEETVVERTLFPDGWCNDSYPGETDATCDPEDPHPLCSIRGVCAELSIGPVCAEECDPTAAANDICRDGYRCDPEHAGCLPGCQSDDQCRIAREETNGVDGLQTPEDCAAMPIACTPTDCATEPADPEACADPASNFDHLVYDTESTATCDPESYRCVE